MFLFSGVFMSSLMEFDIAGLASRFTLRGQCAVGAAVCDVGGVFLPFVWWADDVKHPMRLVNTSADEEEGERWDGQS